jgi:hypothetical protein
MQGCCASINSQGLEVLELAKPIPYSIATVLHPTIARSVRWQSLSLRQSLIHLYERSLLLDPTVGKLP